MTRIAHLWRGMIVGWCVLLACVAQANFTGLLLIPTADIIPPGTYYARYLAIVPEATGDIDQYYLLTQFGISARLEVGVDVNLSSNPRSQRGLLNAKYVAAREPGTRTALALGVASYRESFDSIYTVATYDLRPYALHAGAVHRDDHLRWFVGADYRPNERVILYADYVDGIENGWGVGLGYELTPQVGIAVGEYFLHRTDNGFFALAFTVAGPIRGPAVYAE